MKNGSLIAVMIIMLAAAGPLRAAANGSGADREERDKPAQAAQTARPTAAQLPQTPAGSAVAAYFKAFGEGEEAMRAFFEKYGTPESLKKPPMEVRLARYRQMKERQGALEIAKVITARPDLVSVVASGSGSRFLRFDFEFEAAAPFGLIAIRIEAMGSRDDEAPAPDPMKDDTALFSAVRETARKAVEAGDFSGVVLIARGRTPVFREAFGLADRDGKAPNRTDTKFNIGSICKSFTTLAIYRLAVEKKLSLDDTIGKFLPDYPNRDAAARVTVRQLVNMRSGIGDFFGERYQAADKDKILALTDYLPLFADEPLAFEPGARELYSNGGYIVLGLIIEKVTGKDYYSYIRDNVFKPAGMGDSGWPAKSDRTPGRAVGYVRDAASWKTNHDTLPGRGSSAGGGYSTAGDLLKYTNALEKGIYGPAGGFAREGLGLAGGAPGLNAVLEYLPDRKVTIVVMANQGPPAAVKLAKQIEAWLPR